MSKDTDVDLTEDRLISCGWSLIHKVVCAPKSWDANKVAEEATKADPPGTSANRWVITDTSEDNVEEPWEQPTQCNDCEDRQHWVVNC